MTYEEIRTNAEIEALINKGNNNLGNHDESTGGAMDPVSAALIIADKTDVRRSRVRGQQKSTFDIHDRVNYAVTKSNLIYSGENKAFTLDLKLDTDI